MGHLGIYLDHNFDSPGEAPYWDPEHRGTLIHYWGFARHVMLVLQDMYECTNFLHLPRMKPPSPNFTPPPCYACSPSIVWIKKGDIEKVVPPPTPQKKQPNLSVENNLVILQRRKY